MARYSSSDDFVEAEFVDLDMSRATFREVDLTGVRMYGVVLSDVDIDGYIRGLRVNGVEVEPLIEAELDRLHPERTKLRPTNAGEARQAWAVVESLWATTMQQASRLTETQLHRSVNQEWSFVDTLRHLIFVIDAWFSHAVLGQPRPFHLLGLPATFMTDVRGFGVDPDARPTFTEVVAVRDERVASVRTFLDSLTDEEFERIRPANPAPGWPPPAARSAAECLGVLLNEEWAHRQFAIRDLAIVEATPSTSSPSTSSRRPLRRRSRAYPRD